MEEACAVFSAKGFRDATIAEICERAEANIAAVNYHFGDKESLYNACWRHAFAVTLAAWPLDQGVDASTAPADRLRVFVRAFVRRVLSDDVIGQFPHMLMHLTKVRPFVTVGTWDGQDFRKPCGSFGGSFLPMPPAGSIWRRAGGRMDLYVRTVGAGSIG